MRLMICAVACASLFASSSAAQKSVSPDGARASPYSLTPANRREIIVQIKDNLIDGDSARWRWPKHAEKFGLYCGFVNAKNRMGAYTGFAPFMVLGGIGDGPRSGGKFIVMTSKFATTEASDTQTSVVNKMCAQYGYDLSSIPPD